MANSDDTPKIPDLDDLLDHVWGQCGNHTSEDPDSLGPCRLCDPEDKPPMPTKQEALEEALKRSITALDDWLNTYASEFCHEWRVKEARERIMEEGGTLAYIGDLQAQNRKALGETK
jgi:hypothetical protein